MFDIYSNLRDALINFGTSIAGIFNAFVGIVGLLLGGLVVYTGYRIFKRVTKNVSVVVTYKRGPQA